MTEFNVIVSGPPGPGQRERGSEVGSQPLVFSRSASPARLHVVQNVQGRGPGTALLTPVDKGAIPPSSSSSCKHCRTGE